MLDNVVAVIETLFDISNMGLTMVVPWSVPEDLQDNLSEPRANMGRIVQNKVRENKILHIHDIRDHCRSNVSTGTNFCMCNKLFSESIILLLLLLLTCPLQLQELLIGFDQPVRVELATFEPAFEPDKTEFLLMSFDASEKTEDSVPLLAVDQMDYIRSLNTTDITVRDGVIHWSGEWWNSANVLNIHIQPCSSNQIHLFSS